MADNSYTIEIKPAPKSGYFTPAESNNYYAARYARAGITVHWWGDGTGASNHDNIVNYMNDQAAKAIKSVNYVLSDNKITMCVPVDDVAWCSEKGNPTTISVETQPTLGDEGYKKWGWLVDQLEKRYGHSLQLYRHSEWTQTACPGSISLDRIRAEADRWKSGTYDAPEAPLWTTELITPRDIKVKPGSHKWNLGHHDFASVAANPIETADDDTHFTATAILHHRNIPQYNYYLEDQSTPHGWNVLDCGDYTPPPPPYVPPAEPLKGKPAETYVLDWEVPSFPTPLDAMSHKNANGKLTPKTYTVYAKNDLAYNLTEDNMKPGLWINTRDNVPPEVVIAPLPPKMTEAIKEAAAIADKLAVPQKTLRYEWLRGDHQPVYFHTLNAAPQRFKDLENPETTDQALLPVNKDIRFSMVTIKNGMDYFIPTVSLQNGHRHGIPETMLKEVGVSVPQVKQPNRLDHNNDGRVNIEDITTLMFDYGNKYLKPGVTAVVNTVKAVKKTRFVDGIIAGAKKEKVK